jgi:hypothetical protein
MFNEKQSLDYFSLNEMGKHCIVYELMLRQCSSKTVSLDITVASKIVYIHRTASS